QPSAVRTIIKKTLANFTDLSIAVMTLDFQSAAVSQSAAAHLATSLASDGGKDRRVTRSPVTFASKMASTENRRHPRRVRPPTFVVRRIPLISHVSTVTLLSPVTWHNSAWVKIPA